MKEQEILKRIKEESVNIEGQDGVKYIALLLDDAYRVVLEIVSEIEKGNTRLPINDNQIRAYGLLQLIVKAELSEMSIHFIENQAKQRDIEIWKKEYYSLIGKSSLMDNL